MTQPSTRILVIGAGVCRIVVYHPRKNDDRKLLHYHRSEPGREDLNLLVSLLSSAARPIDEPLERGPCNFCLFSSFLILLKCKLVAFCLSLLVRFLVYL